MKTKLFTLLLLLTTCTLSAQWGGFGGKKGPSIKGKITGSIIDPGTNEGVGYATISLRKAGSEKIINGTLSDENGDFKLADIKDGTYDVEISFLGYETKLMPGIELTLKDPDVSLGDIQLAQDNVVLDEVQITEKRALIENKVDKIIFNAEDDSSIAGGDAADVLRKVPLLSVDLDGNVSIRGSQQVRILINGKPSGMFSANAADALKMFPADQIKKVEVISSPGAKYDGEGSGGIINIITKKDNVEGVAGTFNGSVGNRQNNGNLNLNIGKGRFGFTTNAGLWYSNPIDGTNTFSRIADSGEVLYEFDGITNTSRLGFNGSASAFYDFNAFNAINTSITYRGFGFDRDGTSSGILGQGAFDRRTIGDNLYSGYDWNTDYTRKFEGNEKQELVFAAQLSGNVQNQDNFLTETGFFTRRENIVNDPDNLEITGQIDYVHPVGTANKLEVGVKTVIRNIDSDSQYLGFNEQTDDYDLLDQTRSNLFLYDQDVMAGYLSYNFYLGKINVVTGMRYERTEIAGDGSAAEQDFSNGYDNWLPNIAFSKSLSNFRNIKLSYSQRIQRPSLFFINPFVNTTDFGNISFGNPFLNPELTRQIEFGYNTSFKGVTIFGNLYYKQTEQIIESVVSLSDQLASITSYSNVGENNSIGINLFMNKTIKKFTIRGGGDVFTYNVSGIANGEQLENRQLAYRIFTSGEYAITGKIKADFFAFFNSPRFTLQGRNASFSMYAIAMRYDITNDFSLGVRMVEPFHANKSFDSNIDGLGFTQISSFVLPFRSFGLNVKYKFGKVDFKERKSKIKNSDLKAGEGGGGGGQQGGQQGN
jgi:outer membrane receptor protein involved in Fe transport